MIIAHDQTTNVLNENMTIQNQYLDATQNVNRKKFSALDAAKIAYC